MAVGQKMLASIDLTVDTYGHLEVEDLRAALDRMPGPPIIVAQQLAPAPLAAPLLLPAAGQKRESPDSDVSAK